MNKSYDEFVEKLITDNDCFVKVSHWDADEDSPVPLIAVEKFSVVCRVNALLNNEEYIPLPKYALRMFIFCDIYNRCVKLGISPSLMRYYQNDEKVNRIVDLIDMDEENVLLEKEIDPYINKVINNPLLYTKFEDELEKKNLLAGWQLIKGLIVSQERGEA